jgi:hypothetical protein
MAASVILHFAWDLSFVDSAAIKAFSGNHAVENYRRGSTASLGVSA